MSDYDPEPQGAYAMSGPSRDPEMTRITRWKDVAALLKQGWRVEGFDLVSPTGERRNAWGNAIKACRDRGLVRSDCECLPDARNPDCSGHGAAEERGVNGEGPL